LFVKLWERSIGLGLTPTTVMTDIAIQERFDGKVVDWMEHVRDEQYRTNNTKCEFKLTPL